MPIDQERVFVEKLNLLVGHHRQHMGDKLETFVARRGRRQSEIVERKALVAFGHATRRLGISQSKLSGLLRELTGSNLVLTIDNVKARG
jgi:hypothetical protein